jgi:hypothetical protein
LDVIRVKCDELRFVNINIQNRLKNIE